MRNWSAALPNEALGIVTTGRRRARIRSEAPLSTQTSMPSPLSSLAAAHDSSASASDPNRLAPEDAFYKSPLGRSLAVDGALGGRKRSNRQRSSSGRRKAKGGYKKLLWFRQPCEHLPQLHIGRK
jgi:hypothetical protein